MIRILREYERGVIFRLGKLLGTKRTRIDFSHSDRRSHGEDGSARGDHRRRAPGSHADDRWRRRLFSRHRSSGCGRASGEVPQSDFAHFADNVAQRARTGRTRPRTI